VAGRHTASPDVAYRLDMRHALLLALFTVLASGCPKSAPQSPPGASGDFDERQTCGADIDCAPMVLGCCDHCHDGDAYGVHVDHVDEVEAEYTQEDYECESCPKTKCAPLEGICRNQRCGVRAGDVERVTPLPRLP
jgi:hypothetical protein